jgi:uncharacterized protein with PQ loop repeat
MNDTQIDIFGYIGALLVISVNIPLCIKVYQTKSTQDLSMLTFILTLFAGIFYLIYGILISKCPIIICNAVIVMIAIILIFFKLKYDKNNSLYSSENNRLYITEKTKISSI